MPLPIRFIRPKPKAGPSQPQDSTSRPIRTSVSDVDLNQSSGGTNRRASIDHQNNYIIVPPDGGWGWVIVASAFATFMVTDGIGYCFGLFMKGIARDLKCTMTMVSLTSSIQTALVYLLGPLACAMINRYGFRLVCIIGGSIFVLAFLSCSFSPNLPLLIILLGVIGGGAYSMVYISSSIIVGFYFERWRALATAITVSGSAVGVIIVPIVQRQIKDYSWRQQFQFLSIGYSVVLLAGWMYRPLHPVKVINPGDHQAMIDRLQRIDDSTVSSFTDDYYYQPQTRNVNRYHNALYPTSAEVHGTGAVELSYATHLSGAESKVTDSATKRTNRVASTLSSKSLPQRIPSTSGGGRRFKCTCDCDCCHRALTVNTEKTVIPTRPLYRDDIFFHGTLKKLKNYQPISQSTYSYHMSVTRMPTMVEMEEAASGRCICCPEQVKRILATMLDVKLMKKMSFTIFMISGFFTAAGMYVPYIYISEMNIRSGMPANEATFLLTVIGFSNVIGRVLCGFICISPKVPALIVMEYGLIISGLSVILLAVFSNALIQYCCCCIFGLTIAVNSSLRSIVIVELYGLENLTNAFGIAVLFQGFACIFGLPVAGMIRDVTGSYMALMIFAGVCLLISGILMLPMKYLTVREMNSEYSRRFLYTTSQVQPAGGNQHQGKRKRSSVI